MKDLIIATNNQHKAQEITSILNSHFNIKLLKDIGLNIDVEENGDTFYDNAFIKAKTISDITNLPALADDSGLIVDSLNGLPGVHSARYAGTICDDRANNKKLLDALAHEPNRSARFVSVIVIYFPDGKILSATGSVEGSILYKEQGTGGFGYDPLFLSTELNKSFAEITAEEKNRISHRAKALNALKLQLDNAF